MTTASTQTTRPRGRIEPLSPIERAWMTLKALVVAPLAAVMAVVALTTGGVFSSLSGGGAVGAATACVLIPSIFLAPAVLVWVTSAHYPIRRRHARMFWSAAASVMSLAWLSGWVFFSLVFVIS